MAASPTPQPDPSQQQPGASDAGAPASVPQGGADQQGNQLQQILAKLMQTCIALGQQNQLIAPDMQDAASAFREAFKKTIQSGQQPAPQQQAPPM